MAGDAERADARTLLDEHLSAGRLTIAEHEERHALCGVARTRGDLEALFDDLPLPHPDLGALVGRAAHDHGHDHHDEQHDAYPPHAVHDRQDNRRRVADRELRAL